MKLYSLILFMTLSIQAVPECSSPELSSEDIARFSARIDHCDDQLYRISVKLASLSPRDPLRAKLLKEKRDIEVDRSVYAKCLGDDTSEDSDF